MPTNLYLTDEQSNISGYLKARIGVKSGVASLVRGITPTVTNPATQPAILKQVGLNSVICQWITDPIKGTALSSAAWIFHVWAYESNILANTGLKFTVAQFTNSVQSAFLSATTGLELPVVMQDYNYISGNATGFTPNDGDRLVITASLNNVGGSVSGYNVTVSYNGFYSQTEGDSYITAPDEILPLAITPTDTIQEVFSLLKEQNIPNAPLGTDDILRSIRDALAEYSKDYPRRVQYVLTGDGTSWQFTLPPEWNPTISEILEIEYPVGNQIPTLVDNRYYKIYQSQLGLQPTWYLIFNNFTPDSTANNMIIRYTSEHYHDTVNNTIPSSDLQAFRWLAASYAAISMSGFMAGTTDSSLTSDVVNYRDGVSRWKDVAKSFRDRYEMQMGMKTDYPGQGHYDHWDIATSWNQDYLLHRRRFR